MNKQLNEDLKYRMRVEKRRIFENIENIRKYAQLILESQARVSESMFVYDNDIRKKYGCDDVN